MSDDATPTEGETGDRAPPPASGRGGVTRAIGLGLITGAADNDCSAIGTYAAAGAKMGPSFLWTAPLMFPMMFAVVYLSAKLGQVSGKGLFEAIRDHYPRWILLAALIGVCIGNTFEAGADIGGMAAALDILVPLPFHWTAIGISSIVLAFQIFGSYIFIRNVFRWLSLSLLAYVAAAFMAKPDLWPIIKGTLIPHLRFDREFLSLLVAVIGTSLSAYLYTWQSNQEVEEEKAMGRTRLWQRKGATEQELKHTRRDVLLGMSFSNLSLYFIMLSTASTLHRAGKTDIETAAQAAEALRPVAGNLAGGLFAVGIVAVGFLALPVMTTGAAYDLAQVMGWKHGLSAKPRRAKAFYAAIVGFTALAVTVNFLGLNPMRILVWAGIVQGFSTPPLMLLIMLMTNRRDVMGKQVNGRFINILGWLTTTFVFAATLGLVITWFR